MRVSVVCVVLGQGLSLLHPTRLQPAPTQLLQHLLQDRLMVMEAGLLKEGPNQKDLSFFFIKFYLYHISVLF